MGSKFDLVPCATKTNRFEAFENRFSVEPRFQWIVSALDPYVSVVEHVTSPKDVTKDFLISFLHGSQTVYDHRYGVYGQRCLQL